LLDNQPSKGGRELGIWRNTKVRDEMDNKLIEIALLNQQEEKLVKYLGEKGKIHEDINPNYLKPLKKATKHLNEYLATMDRRDVGDEEVKDNTLKNKESGEEEFVDVAQKTSVSTIYHWIASLDELG
jgi:hypothetical protein